MDFSFFKKHPYGTAVGAAIVALIAYLFSRGSSSGAASTSTSGGTSIEEQQLNAASQAQANQLNAQVQTAQIQASVANGQTAAELQAIQVQTQAKAATDAANIAAQVAVNQSNNDAATTQAADAATAAYNLHKLDADVLTTQLSANAQTQQRQMDDILAAHVNDNVTSLAAVQTQYAYQNNVANLQAGIASKQIDASVIQQQNYEQLSELAIAKAGQPYHTGKDADRATALISQVLAGGNPAPVIANTNASTIDNVANGPGSILNSIGGFVAPILGGMFA